MSGAEAPFEPERLVAALNEAGVRYVIVGGLAVGAHGVIRATQDLDLVADPGQGNMEVLARTLSDLGGRHPISGEALTADTLAAPRSMKVVTRHGELHVLNRMPGTPPYAELERHSVLVEVETRVEAPVCSLAHLREMKRASERPRDGIDLAELDELHGPG